MLRQKPQPVDILILGAGWTSTFLIPLLDKKGVSHAETTTDGRDGTLPFKFDPESDDTKPFESLPPAQTVLITFPLRGHGQSKLLTSLYRKVHGEPNNWIQLGATTIYNRVDDWNDEDSAYDKTDVRGIAEDELLSCVNGCVLNLSGLYGGSRQPATWLPRLNLKTKDDVRNRKAVHFVHGDDVALAILLTHRKFTAGKRWIIADLRVYDWWDLILSFSALEGEDVPSESRSGEQEKKAELARWVGECMVEEHVKALPRSMECLGRKLDSRGFWEFHGVWPGHRRLA